MQRLFSRARAGFIPRIVIIGVAIVVGIVIFGMGVNWEGVKAWLLSFWGVG